MTIYLAMVILHVIGTAIGAGGATFADYIFYKSARDGYIDKSELRLLKASSKLIVLGLAILIVTGIGFLLHYYLVPGSGEVAPKAYAKILIVVVIALNGWFLHRNVMPMLEEHADNGSHILESRVSRHKSVVLASGAISFFSWYSAMILGAWRGLAVSMDTILIIYCVGLVVVVLIAQVVGRWQLSRLR